MHPSDKPAADVDAFAFLMGGGAMGSLIRSMDWSKTSLGPVAGWPQSLRTTVSICLASDLPICVIWGPGLVQLYNDAYRVICGDKHPQSMGQNFAECWREAWPVIGEAHDSAVAGDTAFLETQHIFLERHGYLEECFFTFSFSPIRDETGRVGGLFHPVIEMTTKMLSERRTRALRDLTAQTSKAKSVGEALTLSAQALAEYDLDLPFILLYALEPDSDEARLVGSSGLGAATVARLDGLRLNADEPAARPLAEVARSRAAVQVDNVGHWFDAADADADARPPGAALALPITRPGADRPSAILVAGISPRLPMTEAYRGFYDLLASGVTTAVANAGAYDDERRRAKALAELDRAKTLFFSNVSHEFRTPLTLLLGPVEDALAAADAALPPVQRERLELVHRNGLRLQRLVNSLLDFSRIEAGRVHAAYEPTDLADFTADLASNFRSACEKAGLTLHVDCPRFSEPVVVDRPMWEKIVLNLLSNAFKFTFDGEIAVSMRQVDGAAELRVADTGTGIPAHEIPLLFERFHRVENARGRTHEGSGIGLALVQELVKLHGGAISVDSVVGRGTTFTVSIPLGSQHLPRHQVSTTRTPRTSAQPTTSAGSFVEDALRWLPNTDPRDVAGLGLPSSFHDDLAGPALSLQGRDDDRLRVLVADDNADMRQYVVRLLSPHFRTDAVADGEAALAVARHSPPDLILTDVMMPRLDGFGLLQALRADPRTSSVPVIMLSARAGEESRIEGMQEGADDYLVKPFSARELLARVTAHLQMARMRRESSQTLRQGEQRLRMALTAARMVAWEWTPSDRKLHVSDNAADVFGLLADAQLTGIDQGLRLVHPDDLARYEETFQRALAERGDYLTQYRLVRPDNGAVLWMEERGHTVSDGPDGALRLVGVVMDITDRSRAEMAVRASEGRLRSILESITDGFMALDRDWRFTYMNAAGERFLNRTTPGDLIGKCLWDEYPGAVGSVFEQVYRRVASGGVGESFAAHYPDLARWYEVTAYPAADGLSVYFRDVSEQKRIEEQLRASEERRRLALDAAELGMWHAEPASRAVKTDARFRAIYGTTEEMNTYAEVFGAIHPEDLPAVEQAVAAATQLEQPVPYDIEYRVIHPDGSLRWVFAKGRSTIEGDGATRHVVSFDGTVADITERKRADQEREQLLAQLKEQDRRKDEFLATLAHELRNPLAPIRNGLQILRLTQGDPDATERVRSMMERQLGQMVHLIDDLLDLSRISRGKIDLRMQRIDLAKAIEQAIETSRPAIALAEHALLIDLPPVPVHVDADLTRLAQVFSNLLNNAAKFTAPKGRIRLTLQSQGAEAVVSIQDNGFGIPADMLRHVFEMFTQVDGNLGRSQGGLGIGLSIVERLVQMHGGSVQACSDGHGLGSEFVVRLPMAAWLAEGPAAGTPEPAPTKLRHRILVVDDNLDAADSLALLLTMMGDETRTAHDGQAALDAAAAFRPGVVLLDIGMPKMNGYEVARRIRQQSWGKDIVLIAMTGWGQQEDKRRSLEAGFDFHLVKPVHPAALEALLSEVGAG